MSIFQDLAGNIAIGLGAVLSPDNLFYCFLGVVLGQLVGALPGIGVLVAISLLFPFTFHLEPTSALIMLAGIYYGTAYGGSTASILLNVPGQASSAVTCLDGYPMAKQGRAGVALLMTTVASFVGASIGILLMMLFSPSIAQNALRFGPWEYFSIMVLGLVAASTMGTGAPAKGIAMVVLGIIIGLVGIDVNSGVARFSFGYLPLYDGVGLAAIVMGLFGVPEVIASIRDVRRSGFATRSVSFRSMIPTRDDVSRSWAPILRGTAVGSFFGALPGAGGLIASFMSYAVEKKVARDPSRFGKGAIEGIVAPEAANNAADQTAFIPTMTLGIPGSATMAIVLGVLIIHGVTPGPKLVLDHPELFWGLIMSFWIGNVILVILNIPLIGIWVRVLTVPYHYLYPAIIVFIATGAYFIHNSSFDVVQVVFFGAIGYAIRVLGLSAAPLILGFILGPMMEEHLRRALLLSRGDFSVFLARPISAATLAITLGLLAWAFAMSVRAARRPLAVAAAEAD
ncbi:tripartite tricarboxylate transporter permease [Faunimonas sp. B44]|uniref:tripartite tricarboxylate transporter permease n=1 Tax=Faunimonas sp. B44 TaxID=3461493 RepID=UPI004045005F